MTLSLIISAGYLSSSDCALSRATGVKSDRLLGAPNNSTKGESGMKKFFVISSIAALVMAFATGICTAEFKLGYLDIQKLSLIHI